MTLFVREIAVANYRSLRGVRMPVERLGVFVGANGVGKTNLYRAMQLIQGAALGTLAADLAAEGGMESASWAGERRRHETPRIQLSVGLGTAPASVPGATDYVYAVEVGFPTPTSPAFPLEPNVKEERLTYRHRGRDVVLLDRRGPTLMARDEEGRRVEIGAELLASETALGSLADPSRYPDLQLVRQTLADWRFYHDLRTDPGSPLRKASLAVTSPTLASDGANLAAVFATLAHIREDTVALDAAIDDAFEGARLEIPIPERTATFGLTQPDLPKRIFEPHELSDGTLRYLGLVGALMAYRLPAFVALNEPEASLHPELLDPLGRMIATASERTQIWVVTHSERLAAAIERHGGAKPRTVVKRAGATEIEGLRFGAFRDDVEEEGD
ncbi:MAG TPA: AAA family ATPase [Caulobacteraceae bacterium]|nr:AAA family ATPase [Caulobacteraceae bacterium]